MTDAGCGGMRSFSSRQLRWCIHDVVNVMDELNVHLKMAKMAHFMLHMYFTKIKTHALIPGPRADPAHQTLAPVPREDAQGPSELATRLCTPVHAIRSGGTRGLGWQPCKAL